MKAAQSAQMDQPGHNLLDVHALVVMPGISPAPWPLDPSAAPAPAPSPSPRCRCDRRPARTACYSTSILCSGPSASCVAFSTSSMYSMRRPHALRPGIVRAVRDPQHHVLHAQRLADLHRVQQMPERQAAHLRAGVGDRAVLILRRLEQVRVDRTGSHTVLLRQLLDVGPHRPQPPGRSHRTCSATVGLAPVSSFTLPVVRANFSSMFVAAPGCENFPKRVPRICKAPMTAPQS